MPLHAVLLMSLVISPLILGAVFVNWKTYEVYKAFGGRAHGLGFYWFSFLYQNEWLRTNLGYRDPLEGAPSEVRALATKNLGRIKTTTALLAWWVILIALAAITVSIFQVHFSKGH
jgi:hypothetical protein